MRPRSIVLGAIILLAIVAVSTPARAQGVGLAGKITDSTDAVLPGVTITALHIDSGNTFVGVTDTSGEYRINALRPGVYKVTAELPGFATATQERLELLVGQRGLLNLKMAI